MIGQMDTWHRSGQEQLIDVPVNMRHRLDPTMVNRAGFLITEITTKVRLIVVKSTSLNIPM